MHIIVVGGVNLSRVVSELVTLPLLSSWLPEGHHEDNNGVETRNNLSLDLLTSNFYILVFLHVQQKSNYS